MVKIYQSQRDRTGKENGSDRERSIKRDKKKKKRSRHSSTSSDDDGRRDKKEKSTVTLKSREDARGEQRRERSREGRYGPRDRSRTPRRHKEPRRDRDGRLLDAKLPVVDDDPRKKDGMDAERVKTRGKGRNTESFDPASTFVRPAMRVIVGPNQKRYGKPIKHDDVIIVPNFFCDENDWSLYYDLVAEQRHVQESGKRDSEWISWHEGAHLITKAPSGPIFDSIIEKLLVYFGIPRAKTGMRFNWYRDSNDWKPFHHDSAAFNPERAKNQNLTVGVSLGATRELAFLHANNGTKVYFPQANGTLFVFGRDVNIVWKHAINALKEEEKDGRGRISIVVWGNVSNCIEEEGSPGLLTDSARGNGVFDMHRTGGKKDICRDFARNKCSYGSSCKWSHAER